MIIIVVLGVYLHQLHAGALLNYGGKTQKIKDRIPEIWIQMSYEYIFFTPKKQLILNLRKLSRKHIFERVIGECKCIRLNIGSNCDY